MTHFNTLSILTRMPITSRLATNFPEVAYFRMTQAQIPAPRIQMMTEDFSYEHLKDRLKHCIIEEGEADLTLIINQELANFLDTNSV